MASRLTSTSLFALLVLTASACNTDGFGMGLGSETTDGDGDTDADTESEGDSRATTTTTTTEADSASDGCPPGTEDCPCGDGCDPGLMCEGDACVPVAGTGDSTEEDSTEEDSTDTDTGGGPVPYGECPSGDDADCLFPGEICHTGTQGGQDWSICTHGCNGQPDCDAEPDDLCSDLPGDMMFANYCAPLACDHNNDDEDCPEAMFCADGYQGANDVCLWPY